MIDKLSIHRSKYWQKETCHWKNHQSSNYHVSMLSGKRCETSKCVNTDYFISTSYQLYCEHQCLNVYAAAGTLLQANTFIVASRVVRPMAKSCLSPCCQANIRHFEKARGQGQEQSVSKKCPSPRCGSDFQVFTQAGREERRRSWSPFPQGEGSSREQNVPKPFLIGDPETSCDFQQLVLPD